MATTQAQRAIKIATPLGEDVLLFQHMTATEALGRLFKFEIDLLSKEPDIKLKDLLGHRVTIMLELPDGKARYFCGHVIRLSRTGSIGNFTAYHATAYPWLWFLTRTSNCRIFQEKTVPEIIREVFGIHGFTDFEESLSRTYRTWEYCVQYRETDFEFVSRLMEQEGIYYYFKHDNGGKHTMVLSDWYGSHEPYPGYARIPYYPPEGSLRRKEEHIFSWSVSQELQSGWYAMNEFNFKCPNANLQVKSAIVRDHAMAEMEIFEYPGEYVQVDEGESYARARIEEIQSDYEKLQGEAIARGIAAGSLFKLSEYPQQDQNREYLVVSATHRLMSGGYESAGGGGGLVYSCSFNAIPGSQPFRSARSTNKPIVQGPQTAIVVGPSGSEIYTDKYAQVKVRFHWDRYSKSDETSSCWIRVAQLWAGARWGSIHIPRIGQEVIVEFLEGDPDQPIITGRVYNNNNMPPYDLPANATQSGFKSRSSKGGYSMNVNELRFEDKKGEELIFIQAERNQEIRVKNTHKEFIGKDAHLIVKNDQFENVEGDKHLIVKGDHNEKVSGTISIEAEVDMQEKVGEKHALDAGAEIHLKAGINVVAEAGMNISLKGAGGFITIGPSGVTISGVKVLINSGGSPVSGWGCSPEFPEKAEEPGMSSGVKKETVPPLPPVLTPRAQAFKSAAVSGAPFVKV